MSRQAVQSIIDRAVADESFFEQLRNDPDRAIDGYVLDDSERSAFRAGAYNVVVRASRKERDEQTELEAHRASLAAAARSAPTLVTEPAPPPPRMPVGGLIGFFAAILIIGGGIGAFRYFEAQWPWQALGFAKPQAQASIPAPTLGARPKPSGQASRPAAAGSTAPSAAASSPASAAAKPSGSGQAQLRPSSAASPSSAPSAAPSAQSAQQSEITKAYYQAVGTRMADLMKSFSNVLAGLRAGNDVSKDVADIGNELADLNQHVNDAPPPDQLKQQHQILVQAIPILQADNDQLRAAVAQKNGIQAVLYASEIDAVLNRMPDEMSFATTPHPEIYQPVASSQNLQHILNFDVLSQNVTARSNTPASVMLRIGVQSASPSNDEVSDTLRHSIMVARQTYPQAGQVRVAAYAENNNSNPQQVGTADWYCSPDARPPDASSSSNWQDFCSKIYVTVGGGSPTVVPY